MGRWWRRHGSCWACRWGGCSCEHDGREGSCYRTPSRTSRREGGSALEGGLQSCVTSKKRNHPLLYVGTLLSLIGGSFALCKLKTMRSGYTSLPPTWFPDASYTLRGIIDTLPQATGPDKYIKIHHEELPTFKNKKGEVVGMPEMIMDFEQIAPEVKLGGFKVGDAVEFTFEVRWSPRVVTRVVQMRKLEAGTEVRLKTVREGKSG